MDNGKSNKCLLNGRQRLRRLTSLFGNSSSFSLFFFFFVFFFTEPFVIFRSTIRRRRDFYRDGINLGGRGSRYGPNATRESRDMERNDAVKLINDAAIDRRRLSSRRAAKNFNRPGDFPTGQAAGCLRPKIRTESSAPRKTRCVAVSLTHERGTPCFTNVTRICQILFA